VVISLHPFVAVNLILLRLKYQLVCSAATYGDMKMSTEMIESQIEKLPANEAIKLLAKAVAELQQEMKTFRNRRDADEMDRRARDNRRGK
jgi:hypothetical protein